MDRDSSPAQRISDALWTRGQLEQLDAEGRQGVTDRVDDGRRRADGAPLADALGPGYAFRRDGLHVDDLDLRNLRRGRRQIIGKGRRHQVAGVVVDDFLEQRAGNALRDATRDLAIDDHWIDQDAGVFDHQEALNPNAAGRNVNLDGRDVAGI